MPTKKEGSRDQGRDGIPPNAEPAASPRRLQLGQLASTLQPGGRGVGGTTSTAKDFPHMVLQPDFRKVSGISTEIFRQLESVENDHDATTAAALGAVERRGEMLVRILDGRQFSRPVQDTVRKFISMQDALHSVHFVEIVKRPGQTLGLYIREGNGLDRYDGVFISRIAIESAVFNSGCLGVGDEILAVNLVDVTHMSLDDVVILMSIPRRLVLTIRQRKGQRIMSQSSTTLRSESKLPPVVVIKKELGQDEEMFEDSGNDENGHAMTGLGHQSQYYHHPGVNHYANLRDPGGGGQMQHSLGRGRTPMTTTGQRLFSAPPGVRAMRQQDSIQSLPRHASYQPSYANMQLQHLPDVTDYSRISSRHELERLETPQPPIRRPQYSDYYDQMRPDPPPRPSSQQGGYSMGPGGQSSYDWGYRSSSDRGGSEQQQQQQMSHYHHPHHHAMVSSLPHDGPRASYQPPPPVITEQPRSIVPAHFQPFDRAYPKTLESLAEKVHTFYTGPRPLRHHGPHPSRSSLRIPRTGSDHRLSINSREQAWYGSMPRQRTGDYRSLSLQQPLTPSSQQQQLSARYSSGSRLSGLPTRRKPVLDYASDSEAMVYTPSSMRSSTGLSLPASTRRSLGLSNGGRSNSLPRDFIRGRGGRKHNVRFDKRGGGLSDMSSMAGHRALLLASGLHSEDEGSDGAASAPEMPTPRRERGRIPSSPSVFTSAEYRAWLTRDLPFTRAPSTSAIYERLKTNRDSELLQTQRAAKFTYSAENLSLLDRARNRTERHIKILTDDFDRDRDRNQSNLSNLSLWEARLKTQDQPYYSYRSHLFQTGLTGGDSTIARALAGRSPSTSSALASLGIGQSPLREVAKDQLTPSSSSDPLRRLVGLTPSRSRDLISSFSTTVTGTTMGGLAMSSMDSSTGGRTTPTSALLHRMSDKETDSILRKELLSRSLLGRDHLSLTHSRSDRDTLKEELEEKTEKISARLSSLTSSSVVERGLVSPTPPSILSRTSVVPPTHHQLLSQQQQQQQQQSQPHTHHHHHHHGGSGTGDSRLKLLTINPSEFMRYKIERPSSVSSVDGALTNGGTNGGIGPVGHSGILRVHLLAGRALRSTVRNTDSTVRTRDLYCVLECDRVHKARTVVCTGDQNFDWDEIFELDIVSNKELDFLIYSWDPQLRHRLCYKGSVNLIQILNDTPASAFHQLAIKVEPRGTLYVKLKHTPPQEAFKRELRSMNLFGGDVANVVMKEDSGLNVPLIVQRCIEEIERRGLDIIGLYRLCGSATKKQTLREAFERSHKGNTLERVVDLSAENVPDINVISGVLKDYLRELPEPLLTKCLYQMLVDALGVCLPDDPEGNARLLFSIIECLPKPNRCTLLLILEHLSLVCSLSDRNKMGPTQLAGSFGPILMVHFDGTPDSLDFQPPIKVLQYLLEVWPAKSVRDRDRSLNAKLELGAVPMTISATSMASKQLSSGKGRARPFPRSSPASILSSHPRSLKGSTVKSLGSLGDHYGGSSGGSHLDSKQSPGSLSESSPSPTSIHSTIVSSKLHHTSHPTVTSSSSGVHTTTVLTLMSPSTTSSSLTSVTSPNSLTPVSSTAKSIAPTTTSSNYSLTSEFSTTSVTSPTPGSIKTSDTNEELFTSMSMSGVRGRVVGGPGSFSESSQSATTTTQGYPTATSSASSGVRTTSVLALISAFEHSTTTAPAGSLVEEVSSMTTITTTSTATSQMNLPPSNGFKEMDEKPQQQQIPSSTAPIPQPKQQPSIPPSPFPGRKFAGGPGRAERADSLEEKDSISTKRKLPPLPQGFAHPDLVKSQSLDQPSASQLQQQQQPKIFGQMKDSPQASSFYSPQHRQERADLQQQQQSQPKRQIPEDEDEEEDEEDYDLLSSGRYEMDSPFTQCNISGTSSSSRMTEERGGMNGEDMQNNYKSSKPINVPPPPPPKPGMSARARRDRDREREREMESQSRESQSRSQSQSEEESPPDDSRRGSTSTIVGPVCTSDVTSSATSTPTTVQSQGSNSKGSSPATPPPVPPRLDRRPSQTSPPLQVPPPPPVPPRLGRAAAPVRTPSLDGREAFEVDCYTIKEENGEEDYLT